MKRPFIAFQKEIGSGRAVFRRQASNHLPEVGLAVNGLGQVAKKSESANAAIGEDIDAHMADGAESGQLVFK